MTTISACASTTPRHRIRGCRHLQLNNVIFACQENSKLQAFGTFANEQEFAESQGNQFATLADGTAVDATAANDADLQILEGAQKIYSLQWATSFVDGAAPIASTDPAPATFLGAVDAADDWTAAVDLRHFARIIAVKRSGLNNMK